jgi:hypothetical protein
VPIVAETVALYIYTHYIDIDYMYFKKACGGFVLWSLWAYLWPFLLIITVCKQSKGMDPAIMGALLDKTKIKQGTYKRGSTDHAKVVKELLGII